MSLLVSILLPSLAQARRLARSAVCKTLFRGYGLATEMYAQENDNMMMDSYKHLDGEVGIPKYWGGNKLPEDVARCPDDVSTEALGRLGEFSQYDDLKVSIGGNENMLSCSARMTRYGPMEFWVKRDDLCGRPAQLMVWSEWQNNPADGNPEYAVIKPAEGSMGSLCFRHTGNVANAVYLDGHVGTMRPEVEVANDGHDLADGANWSVSMVGKMYKCYYPFGVGASQTVNDDYSQGVWPGIKLD